ncbi:MAG: glycosyltransferase family 2 protein [Lachnospiraceae bacterium]
MKKISFIIPCYNEEENVEAMYQALSALVQQELSAYDYDILFIDNKSKDRTRSLLRGICQKDQKVKAIFNTANFGQFNSPYYGMCQTDGDCTILLCCDFQDPLYLIMAFVKEWEAGAKVVCGIKTSSRESRVLYMLRSAYYKVIKKLSDVEQIEHFTGFGLYDASFVEILRDLDDPTPFLRGIVAEYAPDHVEIAYEQEKRRGGKTHNNWYTLYDAAMLSFTSYTKIGLRIATLLGFVASGVSILIAIVYLILKLIFWDRFAAGQAPMLIGVFLMGGIQLLFIGLLGEYLLSVHARLVHRPLVVEEQRLNFEKKTRAKE